MTTEDRKSEAEAVMSRAQRLYDAADLDALYERMAGEITASLGQADPIILCVMVGGMVPAVEITKRLAFPFDFDYLHATRYRGDTRGGELVWKVSPEIDLTGRQVLVIDDILDEGHTLEAILTALGAQGAAAVKTAILLVKDHHRRDPKLRPDFVGAEVPDRYVVGAGMDYKGYYRQLPAVYALTPEDDR